MSVRKLVSVTAHTLRGRPRSPRGLITVGSATGFSVRLCGSPCPRRRDAPGESMPEAVHGVLGDEFQRIHEGKDHAAERTDGAPSLAEGAPVKDLETIS